MMCTREFQPRLKSTSVVIFDQFWSRVASRATVLTQKPARRGCGSTNEVDQSIVHGQWLFLEMPVRAFSLSG
jgi:hypothetical protein